jgi:hypothetical protein
MIFRGDRWCNIAKPDNRRYLGNAYRVLLTRARQGMVIFVPQGDLNDPTRSPVFYHSTFNYPHRTRHPRVALTRPSEPYHPFPKPRDGGTGGRFFRSR